MYIKPVDQIVCKFLFDRVGLILHWVEHICNRGTLCWQSLPDFAGTSDWQKLGSDQVGTGQNHGMFFVIGDGQMGEMVIQNPFKGLVDVSVEIVEDLDL